MAQGCAFCSVANCYPCLWVSNCLTVPGWATRVSCRLRHSRTCEVSGITCCRLRRSLMCEISGITCRLRRLQMWFGQRHYLPFAAGVGTGTKPRLSYKSYKSYTSYSPSARSGTGVCASVPHTFVAVALVCTSPSAGSGPAHPACCRLQNAHSQCILCTSPGAVSRAGCLKTVIFRANVPKTDQVKAHLP